MSIYEIARDKRITIASLVFEVFALISLLLLADSVIANVFQASGLQAILTKHLSITTSVVIVLIIQYILVALEMVARYREDIRSFTLPVVWLPFGNWLRLLVMILIVTPFALIKLICYFVSALIEFVFMITRLNAEIEIKRDIDWVDTLLEPIECDINCLYNFLYYNKIHTNGNIFNAIFNGNLTMWCINH